jgi:hypothetical protein
MKQLLFVITAFIFIAGAEAQDSTFIYIKAGTAINEAIPGKDVFYYPQFKLGRAFFKDGNTGQARMNYHQLLNEMQFIDMKGDTLAVDNERNVDLITIDNDSFYYNQGFVKLISNKNGLKLAIKHSYIVFDKLKIGGYNMANPTSSINSYTSYYDGQSVHKLTVREDIIMKKMALYFLSNKQNRFVPANRKNTLELLPKKEKAVSDYLNATSIDFNSRADLEKLILFLSQL